MIGKSRRVALKFIADADAAGRPLYDTGHNLPQNQAVKETLDWLDKELGAVK